MSVVWCVFLLVPSCARRSPPTPIVNNGRNSRQDTTASTVIRICERICPRYVQYMPSSTSTHTHTQTHARVQRSVQRELGGCGRGLRGGRGAGAGGRGAGALRRHRVKATCGWVVTRERTLSLSLCPAGSSKFATIERRTHGHLGIWFYSQSRSHGLRCSSQLCTPCHGKKARQRER